MTDDTADIVAALSDSAKAWLVSAPKTGAFNQPGPAIYRQLLSWNLVDIGFAHRLTLSDTGRIVKAALTAET